MNELQEKLDQSEAIRKEQLETIENLKKELASQGRANNLFKQVHKPTRANGSGSAMTYSSELKSVAIASLAEGIPASNIKKVLDVIAFTCESLVTPEHTVPREDWFRKIRTELRVLNNKQLLSFVQGARFLTLSFDETSLRKKKPGCLGLIDDKDAFLAVSFDETVGKTGLDLSESMWRAIDDLTMKDSNDVTLATLIRRKLVAIMSDRSRVQEAANRHFSNMLDLHPDRNGMGSVAFLICLMHTLCNAERYFTRKLDDDTLRVFSLIRRIFGCRSSSAYNKHGLTEELFVFTKSRRTYESDIGSRYGTFVRNGRSLILHEDATVDCLDGRFARHITDLQSELSQFMASDQWPRLRVKCGLFAIAWWFALEDFHRVTSKPEITLGEAKEAMQACSSRYVCLFRTENYFRCLFASTSSVLETIETIDLTSLSKESVDAIVKLKAHASALGDDVMAEIDLMFRDASASMLVKVNKDIDLMSSVDKPDSYILPMTNRANVSQVNLSNVTFSRSDHLPTSSSSTDE